MYTNVKQTVFIRKVVRTHSKQTKGIKQSFHLKYNKLRRRFEMKFIEEQEDAQETKEKTLTYCFQNL